MREIASMSFAFGALVIVTALCSPKCTCAGLTVVSTINKHEKCPGRLR